MSAIEATRGGFGADDHGRHHVLPVARVLHWTVAALILFMLASGVAMTQLGGGPVADALFGAHKLTGALVCVLVAARLAYRVIAQARRRWAPQVGGHGVHFALYAAALLTPLLGWAGISDFGARTTIFGITLPPIWPEGLGWDGWLLTAHAWLAFALIGLVVGHIGVALHDYVMRGAAGEMPEETGR